MQKPLQGQENYILPQGNKIPPLQSHSRWTNQMFRSEVIALLSKVCFEHIHCESCGIITNPDTSPSPPNTLPVPEAKKFMHLETSHQVLMFSLRTSQEFRDTTDQKEEGPLSLLVLTSGACNFVGAWLTFQRKLTLAFRRQRHFAAKSPLCFWSEVLRFLADSNLNTTYQTCLWKDSAKKQVPKSKGKSQVWLSANSRVREM